MAERGGEKARSKVEITPEEMLAISQFIRGQKVTDAERKSARWGVGVKGGVEVLYGAALAATFAVIWGVDLAVPGLGTSISPFLKVVGAATAFNEITSGAGGIWKAARMSDAEAEEEVKQKKINTYKSRLLMTKRTVVWQTMIAEWQAKRNQKKAATA